VERDARRSPTPFVNEQAEAVERRAGLAQLRRQGEGVLVIVEPDGQASAPAVRVRLVFDLPRVRFSIRGDAERRLDQSVRRLPIGRSGTSLELGAGGSRAFDPDAEDVLERVPSLFGIEPAEVKPSIGEGCRRSAGHRLCTVRE